MRLSRSLAALAVATILAVPATAAAADSIGQKGKVEAVEVFAPASDTHNKYHGRIFVNSGNSKQEYRWGGTSCGNKVIDDTMLDLLYRAMRNNSMRIVPAYKSGQGSTRCLVGFKLEQAGKKGKPKPS